MVCSTLQTIGIFLQGWVIGVTTPILATLIGGTLDGSEIHVTSDVEHDDPAPSPTHANHPIEQTDKPRAGIAAEYLAKGYLLGDHILQRKLRAFRLEYI